MEFKLTMGEMEEAVRALYKMKHSLKTLDSSLGKLQREIQQQDGKLAKAMNIAYGGHRDTVDRKSVAVEKLFTYLSSYMEDFRSIDGEIYPNRPSIINPSYLRTVAKSEEQALHDLSYSVFASHAPPRSMFPVLEDKPEMKANQTHNKQVLEELDRELKQKIRQLQDSEGHELAKTAKKMEQLLQMEQRHASRIEKDYRNYDRNKVRQIGAGMKVTATSMLDIFFHPVQTVKGLGSLATSFLADPLETTKLVAYQSLLEPYEQGDAYGYTNVVTGMMGVIGVAGGINRLARLKKFGSIKGAKDFFKRNKAKKIPEPNTKKIQEFIAGTKTFEEVLDEYAAVYAKVVHSNEKWNWQDDFLGSEKLTIGQQRKIKKQAIVKGFIPNVKVTKVDGMKFGFADFKGAGLVKKTVILPKELWNKSDKVQFKWLNDQIGGEVAHTTWHHTETPGKMELVDFGIHFITKHNGGRTKGMWAEGSR